MKNQKGITLVALVVTIIVLLILAGVSITMISGDDGIVQRASDASEKTKENSDKEMEDLDSAKEKIDQYANGGEVDSDDTVEEIEFVVYVYTLKTNAGTDWQTFIDNEAAAQTDQDTTISLYISDGKVYYESSEDPCDQQLMYDTDRNSQPVLATDEIIDDYEYIGIDTE